MIEKTKRAPPRYALMTPLLITKLDQAAKELKDQPAPKAKPKPKAKQKEVRDRARDVIICWLYLSVR